jgi:hypothetical protein
VLTTYERSQYKLREETSNSVEKFGMCVEVGLHGCFLILG